MGSQESEERKGWESRVGNRYVFTLFILYPSIFIFSFSFDHFTGIYIMQNTMVRGRGGGNDQPGKNELRS